MHRQRSERGFPDTSIPIDEDASAWCIKRLLDLAELRFTTKQVLLRLNRRGRAQVLVQHAREFFRRKPRDHVASILTRDHERAAPARNPAVSWGGDRRLKGPASIAV